MQFLFNAITRARTNIASEHIFSCTCRIGLPFCACTSSAHMHARGVTHAFEAPRLNTFTSVPPTQPTPCSHDWSGDATNAMQPRLSAFATSGLRQGCGCIARATERTTATFGTECRSGKQAWADLTRTNTRAQTHAHADSTHTHTHAHALTCVTRRIRPVGELGERLVNTVAGRWVQKTPVPVGHGHAGHGSQRPRLEGSPGSHVELFVKSSQGC